MKDDSRIIIDDEISLIDDIKVNPTQEEVDQLKKRIDKMVVERTKKIKELLADNDQAVIDMEKGMES